MAWYNTSWRFRIKLTVQASQVVTDIENFPIYLDLSLLPSAFFSNVRSDGGDIRITDADGMSEHPREVVTIDTVANTGEVHFLGDISDSVDTDFYIYYGNASATDYARDDTFGLEAVWSEYSGVWHLGETTGGTGAILDSSPNQNHGTDNGVTLGQAGKLDDAPSFDGVNDQVVVSHHSSLNLASMTIAAWINISALPGLGEADGIVEKGESTETAGVNHNYLLSLDEGVFGSGRALLFMFEDSSGANFQARFAFTHNTGEWYHIVGVFNDAANVLTLYQNGVAVAETTGVTATPNTQIQDLNIGSGTHPGGAFFSGLIDEVRIVDVARPASGIQTAYNNQNDPASFFAIGAVESADLSISVSDSISAAESVTIQFGTILISVSDAIGVAESMVTAFDTLHISVSDSIGVSDATDLMISEGDIEVATPVVHAEFPKLMMLVDNEVDNSFVILTASSASQPVSNIKHEQIQRIWRSAGSTTTATLTVNMNSQPFVNSAAIGGFNFESTALVTLSQSMDGETFHDIQTKQVGRASVLYWRFTAANTQYWRFTINDPDNNDEFLEVGRIFLGVAYEPLIHHDYDWSLSFEDTSLVRKSIGGQKWTTERTIRARIDFSLSTMMEADVINQLLPIARLVGTQRDFFLILFPDDGLVEGFVSLYGRFETIPGFRNVTRGAYSTDSIVFVESPSLSEPRVTPGGTVFEEGVFDEVFE